MKEIPEDLVTRTWQAMSQLSSAQARREMAGIGRQQPELLAFILGSVMDCRPEVQELTVYLFSVIHKIFNQSTKKKLRPVTAAKIERRLTRNEEHLDRLTAAHPRFQERAAHQETGPQPHVVQYLMDAIMELPDEEEPIILTEEEIGTLYIVLKTAIDLLNDEWERAENK